MKLKRRNTSNPEFSLAAMVDVFLLLLIFFMVTSAVSQQSAIDVKLPQGNSEAPNISNPLAVSISSDGSFFVDELPVQKQDLEREILARMQNAALPSFTIRADENAMHKDVVFVMEIAEKHKYSIAIATQKAQ